MGFEIEYIDHDADAGLDISADNPVEIFRGAALGMLDLIIHRDMVESRTSRIIHAASKNKDLLLVEFLSELLYLVQVEHFAVTDVQIGNLENDTIIAEATGHKDIPQSYIKREIKDVTYHQLKFEKLDIKWKARVIFDL